MTWDMGLWIDKMLGTLLHFQEQLSDAFPSDTVKIVNNLICISFSSNPSILASPSLTYKKDKELLYVKDHLDGRDHDLAALIRRSSSSASADGEEGLCQPQVVFVIGGFLLEFYSYPPTWLSIAEFW